ncbi:MAG: hypothetical protein IJB02_02645, partial [Oscillospiraceae bacterium]|nr:hypothetical protein [Oscillospiraceae bacterium]
QGVCSSLRYSIYKVQNALRFCGELVKHITQGLHCQELFSFLVNFFALVFCSFHAPSGTRPSIISKPSPIVKLFFANFAKIFGACKQAP